MKKMKSSMLVMILLSSLLLLVNCSDDSSSTSEPEEKYSVYLHWNNDSVKVLLNDMPTTDVDGETAIKLSDFITRDLISDESFIVNYIDDDGNEYEGRDMYSYRLKGNDGFSASVKGYPNNIWDHMEKGYIMKDIRRVIFPDDIIDLPGAYNVSDIGHIEIFRKFDLCIQNQGQDTTFFYNLKDFDTEMIVNHDGEQEAAIALSKFVEQLAVDSVFMTSPENLEFNMRSIDDFGPSENMSWEEFKTGYWLTESNKTLFTNGSLSGGKYKVKKLKKIIVY